MFHLALRPGPYSKSGENSERRQTASAAAPPEEGNARDTPATPLLPRPWLGPAHDAQRRGLSIAASACDDMLTTTLGYVQRRVALRDITNHV